MVMSKIIWVRRGDLTLIAYSHESFVSGITGLRETDMDPIHEWSKTCNCGVRTSFDMWKFKSEKELAWFLLRWS